MRPEVAIDASRAADSVKTGTEWYSYELIRAMIEIEDRPDLLLYHRDHAHPYQSAPQVRHRVLRVPRLWTHLGLSAALVRDRPRTLFVPSHVIPAIHPRNSVVTIHDLGYLHEPGSHSRRSRATLDLTTRWNAARSRHIVAVSNQTRADLIDHYRVASDKISVIHSGVDHERFYPNDSKDVPLPQGVRRPFILFVSTVQPRKNVNRLIEAFVALNEPNLQLVIAGKSGWLADEIEQNISLMAQCSKIHRMGYVASNVLRDLYSSAEAYVLPSLYEGFGLGVLEAMASGCPVVVSNNSSLPEVAGDAAVYIDPLDVDSMRDGIRRVLDPIEQQRLRIAGLSRARSFTWDKTARATLAVIMDEHNGG